MTYASVNITNNPANNPEADKDYYKKAKAFRIENNAVKIKTLAVVLHGCEEHAEWTRWKRHCSLHGQWRTNDY